MMLAGVGSLLLAAAEPPVVPDRDKARRWAAEELANPRYPDAQPGWIDQLWRDFLDWLGSFEGDGTGTGPNLGIPLMVVLGIVLIVVAIVVVRPRLNARRTRESTDIFDADGSLDAAGYRKRAATAADDGDWPAAVVDLFRAVVRAAEERDVIDARPGRTADEAASQLGEVFAAARHQLGLAARLFDAVRYGKESAAPSDYESLRQLDASLAAMKPDFAADRSAGFAVPR